MRHTTAYDNKCERKEWFTYIQRKRNMQNTLETTTTTTTLFFFLYRNGGFVYEMLFLLLAFLVLSGGRGAMISIASSPEREKGEEDRRGRRGNFRKRRG